MVELQVKAKKELADVQEELAKLRAAKQLRDAAFEEVSKQLDGVRQAIGDKKSDGANVSDTKARTEAERNLKELQAESKSRIDRKETEDAQKKALNAEAEKKSVVEAQVVKEQVDAKKPELPNEVVSPHIS